MAKIIAVEIFIVYVPKGQGKSAVSPIIPAYMDSLGGRGRRVYTLTITTKFALGDKVRFDSPTQRCSGTGTVEAIVVYSHGRRDYMIALDEFDEFDVQPGILEDEITLLSSGEVV